MKKINFFALLLSFLFVLVGCGNSKPTQLGTSDFSIVLPAGYASVEDDFDEDQVAYYYKDDNSVDFDVYQWEKGTDYTLESEANHFAGEYGTTAESVTINSIDGWKYVSQEEYEGAVYTVLNYMFEDDTYIVEICFWTDGSDKEYAVVDDILSTLKKN